MDDLKEFKSRIEQADPALLRDLLKDALGALDTIAADPIPGDTYNHSKADRYIARSTAKRIRDQL